MPKRPYRIRAFARRFRAFFRTEAAGGVVLLICTPAALFWANSPYAESYFQLWQTRLSVGVEAFGISKSLLHWVNDGLMAIFFLLVGLEIKREVLGGELSTAKGAALPLAGALGGMVVPAAIYAAIAAAGAAEDRRGWAVPMATDIAFALGILALLGRRVPSGLKVFLAALAIADDLGAVLVIAIFYTSKVSLVALGWAGAFLAALVVANRIGVRRAIVYVILGIGLWVGVLKSGIHATIAGVLLAMTIPARPHAALDGSEDDRDPATGHASLLQRMEHALHPWVAFGVMPIFALANAGVALGGDREPATHSPAAVGTFFGLVVGKQVGVFAFAWLAVRMGLARLPAGATYRQVYGVACLCGIGFTMSLFIAGLAFPTPAVLDAAKIGVLVASACAAILGAAILLVRGRAVRPALVTAG